MKAPGVAHIPAGEDAPVGAGWTRKEALKLGIESKPGDPLSSFRCAVVVERRPTPLSPAPVELHWFNGDEGAAQRVADEWCRSNPGLRAWVMTATGGSPGIASVATKWKSS